MATTVLALIVVALANLGHRLMLLPQTRMTFDSWGHLYFSVEVKRSRSGPFDAIRPQVLGAEDFYYPLLPHWLYSWLPEGVLRRAIGYLNPLLETAFLTGSLGLFAVAGFSREVVLWAAITYILTPMWFTKLAIGPRVLNFTTRIVSEVFYPLALAVLLLPLPLPTPLAVACGAALLAIVLLSSKFGTQAVLLVTPLVALFSGSSTLFIALLLSPLIAFAVSKGAFRRQLAQQAEHLSWYVQSLREGKMPIQSRNALEHLTTWSPAKSPIANLRSLIFNWCARNSLTGMLIRAPHFILFWLLGGIFVAREVSTIPFWISAPVIGAGIVFAAVSTRWLLFIGEAERYVSHVSIFVNIAVVLLAINIGAEWVLWALVAYGLIFTVAEFTLLRKGVNENSSHSESAALAYLSSMSGPLTVLPYPYHVVTPYRIMIETQHRCVFPWLAGSAFKDAIAKIEDYPYVDLRALDESTYLNSVDVLVISKQDREERLSDWSPSTDWRAEDVEIEGLEIFRRRPKS